MFPNREMTNGEGGAPGEWPMMHHHRDEERDGLLSRGSSFQLESVN
jgi:hypothetical protein